jgi:hypothetical protein
MLGRSEAGASTEAPSGFTGCVDASVKPMVR